jgi:hypothetical protein
MIAYPGYYKIAQAEYGVTKRADNGTPRADIVVINSARAGMDGTSLWNTEPGRDHVLNTILARDLWGFPIDRIGFFVMVDVPLTQTMHALQLLIEPANWWGRLAQRGGLGRYRSRFDYRRHLAAEEIRRLCTAVGYRRDTSIPAWLDGILLSGPLSAFPPGEEVVG